MFLKKLKISKKIKEDEPIQAEANFSDDSRLMKRFINQKPEQIVNCLPDFHDNSTLFGELPVNQNTPKSGVEVVHHNHIKSTFIVQ